ncbi:anthranilate synthase beta subunit 1, chloroplastic-like [Zingiber officinale]|uniref:anthranilate synthase beta subunit 1, chloroplastic-like n=1 Tax=Zingiber officinale TaxID=94328 RepID=UPI001C4BDB4E|nr:anthranilate synthase beta subunit 1, chloroplastic-like [Zingiber officinale]
MASSLLSLAPKPYAAPQTPRNGGPRRLSAVGATAVFLPSRSPGLSRGRLSLGRSTLPTTLRVSVVGNGAAVSVSSKDERPIVVIDNYDSFTYNLCQVVLVGKTPYNKFGYSHTFCHCFQRCWLFEWL